MRNYIILNGKNSNEIAGLLIQNLPPISKPLQRTLVEEIDGRDGDIVTKLGYGAYDKEFSIGLYGNYDVDQVISYFNSEGVVTFSNEPDKYYNYQIIDQIDFERLIRFKTAIVRMHVQPFKYLKDEEQIQVDAQNLSGEGTDIKLEYTTKDAALKIEPKGNTHQDSYTGKNLFDIDTSISYGAGSGVTIIKNNDGSYTLNGTSTGGATFFRGARVLNEIHSLSYTSNKTSNGVYVRTRYSDITESGIIQDQLQCINSNGSVSSSKEIKYVEISIANGTELDDFTIYPQLELGSTTTEFEKFVGGIPSPNPDYPQPIEVVTGDNTINVHGKNLYYIEPQTKNGVTLSYDSDGAIVLNGTSNSSFIQFKSVVFLSGRNTLSVTNPTIQNNTFIRTRNKSGAIVHSITLENTALKTTTKNENITTLEITIGAKNVVYNNFKIYAQIEQGSTATTYEPYQGKDYEINLGNIELCKIGDYQDYIYKENNKWYKHSEIGKVVLDGSENGWALRTSTSETYIKFRNNNAFPTDVKERLNLLSNYFVPNGGANNSEYSGNAICGNEGEYAKWLHVSIDRTIVNSLDAFKAWLGTHNLQIYYQLATPTNTEITDTDLIEQLDALDQAKTIEETTYISSSSESNLPFLLTASAKGMNNTIIENIGNIFAKPIITIYGSGEVAVYLDKVQILQIDLADSGSITIDVSKLEAYNKDTNELMNRSVIGDYSNLKIQCGENELTFSGNVTGFTMDKYTRWL